jgi:ADP-L-glycero-D-manno-heptose 6-epimerase
MEHRKNSGIYNLGTGIAREFNDLGKSTFVAMDKQVSINYIDTPEDIRDKYQYFTEANMQKLRSIGYEKEFYSLEEGVKDYVQNYLIPGKYW